MFRAQPSQDSSRSHSWRRHSWPLDALSWLAAVPAAFARAFHCCWCLFLPLRPCSFCLVCKRLHRFRSICSRSRFQPLTNVLSPAQAPGRVSTRQAVRAPRGDCQGWGWNRLSKQQLTIRSFQRLSSRLMRIRFPTRIMAGAVLFAGIIAAAGGAQAGHAYCQSSFLRYFRTLQNSEAPVSPVQRFVLSLLLANTRTPAAPQADACSIHGPAPVN